MAQKELSIDDIVKAFTDNLGVAQEALSADNGPKLLMTEKKAASLLLENIKKAPDFGTAISDTLDGVCPTHTSWMLVWKGVDLDLLRTLAPQAAKKAPAPAPAEGGGLVNKAKTVVKDAVAKADQMIPGGKPAEQEEEASK